jgi:protoheme IX farnesyltransferase
MKAAVLEADAPVALTRSRAADYLALTKPRVAVLVLFTVAAGGLLAAGRAVDVLALLNTVLGTALVAAGASALNQWLERYTDARMKRTADRPLPAGRLAPAEALAFGLTLGVVGVAYLALTLPRPWAAVVAAITFVLYVAVYTPAKTRTAWNTLIGAVPGALPPVIGWVALCGDGGRGAGALFLVLFLWQVPHFYAIAWIYRVDYARAGHRMLPTGDPAGVRTGRQMVAFCVALLAASLLPALLGDAGPLYAVGAALLGAGFLASAVQFACRPSDRRARRVLRASLLYLPGLLGLLLLFPA